MIRRLMRRREMHSTLLDNDTFTYVMIAVMSVGVVILFHLANWIYTYSVWMMNQ